MKEMLLLATGGGLFLAGIWWNPYPDVEADRRVQDARLEADFWRDQSREADRRAGEYLTELAELRAERCQGWEREVIPPPPLDLEPDLLPPQNLPLGEDF